MLVRDPRRVFVDFSWLMFLNYHAMPNLTVQTVQPDEDGMPTVIDVPTGHVFGSVRTITQLATVFSQVILVLDGGKAYRRAIYPEYKAHRKPLPYNLFNDQKAVVTMASFYPNVYFARVQDYEADDLIATAMKSEEDIVIYTTDKDIMQTRGRWTVLDYVNNGEPVFWNFQEKIYQALGLSGFDFLPIWWKVVRGDSSDNIPPGVPRMRSEKLMDLVRELSGTQDFDLFLKYVAEKIKPKNFDPAAALRNYKLVLPRYYTEDKPWVFRFQPTGEQVAYLLAKYRLDSLYPLFFS